MATPNRSPPAWIIAARGLEITLASIVLGISIYLVDSDGWWGYNTRLYEFACTFLAGNTLLFGTYCLLSAKTQPEGNGLLTFWIDIWAVAYCIASGILLMMCSNINWQGGIKLVPAIISFINAGLVTCIMLHNVGKAFCRLTPSVQIVQRQVVGGNAIPPSEQPAPPQYYESIRVTPSEKS